MKNRYLRVLALALLLALTTGVVPAMAATRASLTPQTLYLNCGKYYIEPKNWTDEETIVSVVSSKPNIIKVPDRKELYILPKVAGKAKIKIKYKLNGTSHTISAWYTVERYPSPISSLKVNGERANLDRGQLERHEFHACFGEDFSAIINLKPASGWSILRIIGKYWKPNNPTVKKRVEVRNNRRFWVKKNHHALVTYTLISNREKIFMCNIDIGNGE